MAESRSSSRRSAVESDRRRAARIYFDASRPLRSAEGRSGVVYRTRLWPSHSSESDGVSMSHLLALYTAKQVRLKALLEEAWSLEAELNELHRRILQSPADPVKDQSPWSMVQGHQAAKAALRDEVTTRRIKLALLKGPLAVKGQKFNTTILVERCEDIPGASKVAVRDVLKGLVKQGFIRRQGNRYWRAA